MTIKTQEVVHILFQFHLGILKKRSILALSILKQPEFTFCLSFFLFLLKTKLKT